MKTLTTPEDMAAWSAKAAKQPGRIALVPTMGYLHEGHLSLMRIAREKADTVLVSLFVNPTQFGPGEDYESYKRDLAGDAAKCAQEGVDLLFAPAATTMYAKDHSVEVHEEQLARGLCGRSRPGHFDGVLTIVTKLFNLCRPDIAVFGEKDGQQLRLIKRLVRDLDIPVEILSGATIREADGLAMSSRNAYLSPEERAQAVCLRQALDQALQHSQTGERDAATLLQIVQDHIAKHPLARLDYAELVDNESLVPIQRLDAPALLALAVYFGQARLIDNQVLIPKHG